jgi:hypothetical protein
MTPPVVRLRGMTSLAQERDRGVIRGPHACLSEAQRYRIPLAWGEAGAPKEPRAREVTLVRRSTPWTLI